MLWRLHVSDKSLGPFPSYEAAESYEFRSDDGVSFLRSEVTPGMIDGGMSNTFLIGEKLLNPDHYTSGEAEDDNQPVFVGQDWDVNRWTYKAPLRDIAGLGASFRFGAVHANAFHMSFCDGRVESVSYEIDHFSYQGLGSRNLVSLPGIKQTD